MKFKIIKRHNNTDSMIEKCTWILNQHICQGITRVIKTSRNAYIDICPRVHLIVSLVLHSWPCTMHSQDMNLQRLLAVYQCAEPLVVILHRKIDESHYSEGWTDSGWINLCLHIRDPCTNYFGGWLGTQVVSLWYRNMIIVFWSDENCLLSNWHRRCTVWIYSGHQAWGGLLSHLGSGSMLIAV